MKRIVLRVVGMDEMKSRWDTVEVLQLHDARDLLSCGYDVGLQIALPEATYVRGGSELRMWCHKDAR